MTPSATTPAPAGPATPEGRPPIWRRVPHLLAAFSATTVGLMGARLLALLTVPFLARGIGVEGYGVWDTVIVLVGFAALLGRLGMDQATCHFIGLSRTPEDIRGYASTGFRVVVLSAVAIAAALFLLLPTLAGRLFPGSLGSIAHALIASMVITEAVLSFVYDLLRFTRGLFWYLCGMNALALLILAGVGALYGMKALTLQSALYVYVLSSAAVAGALLWRSRRHLGGRLDRGRLLPMLSFGLPLIVSTASFVVMTGSGRVFLAALARYQELGLYAMAYKLALVLNVMLGAFGVVWTPFAYEAYVRDPQRARRQFGVIAKWYVFAGCVAAIILIAGASPLVVLIGGEAFADAAAVVPLILGAVLCNAFGNWFCVGIDLTGRTAYRALGAAGAAALNLVLNAVLIPPLGMMGAAVAAFAAYWIASVSLMVLSQRFFEVEHRLVGQHAAFILIGGAAVLTAMGAPRELFFGFLAAVLGVLWLLLGLRRSEISAGFGLSLSSEMRHS